MAFGCDELLRQGAAAPIVADFMIRTGFLEQFRNLNFVAMGEEAGNRIHKGSVMVGE